MDRSLMQYLNIKCALTLCQSVKKVVLDFQQPVALLRVSNWETNWAMI